MVNTYRAGRRIKIEPERWREPGQLVPEAHAWYRLDSYLHTGYLDPAEVGEAEFRAAVEQFCPQLTAQILPQVGLAAEPTAEPADAPADAPVDAPADAPARRAKRAPARRER